MTRHKFYSLGEKEQIAALGELAAAALPAYGMTGAQLTPIAYRENMTFAVDAGAQGRFALRVHQAGYRSDAEVQSELDFMEYVASVGVRTPSVVRAQSGASFVYAEHARADVPRQCDVFEWIDGRVLRKLAQPPEVSIAKAVEVYTEVGRQVAQIYNATENWQRPRGFTRPAWDAEGIFGVNGHLGDFRLIKKATPAQRALLDDIAAKLTADLAAFGKTPDRYGLSQADLLPENIMVCADGIRLLDFDDTGESWVLFDFATALMDLAGGEYFDPSLGALLAGFREHRALPDEHLAMLPAFVIARVLSYVAHTTSRSHLAQAEAGQQLMLAMLEEHGRAYLAG